MPIFFYSSSFLVLLTSSLRTCRSSFLIPIVACYAASPCQPSTLFFSFVLFGALGLIKTDKPGLQAQECGILMLLGVHRRHNNMSRPVFSPAPAVWSLSFPSQMPLNIPENICRPFARRSCLYPASCTQTTLPIVNRLRRCALDLRLIS